ncbi:hypothetical protein XENOCAPTIV_007797 [Xenoophorus captivus]|uniref:Uncharacterized protein n=1 Tax=Xenoophorus captivus TaxID=1517983 RepID=A0ABV0RLY6_9TELE
MFSPGLQVLLFLLTAAETFEVSLRTHILHLALQFLNIFISSCPVSFPCWMSTCSAAFAMLYGHPPPFTKCCLTHVSVGMEKVEAGSPKPAGLHPPLTRVASSPTFPSVPSSTPSSPSPVNETPSPTVESVTMSPPAPQPPNMWPSHTQPLFSLANVISMAMSMAQSFIPPPNLPTQVMPSYPGFHPQLQGSMAPPSGYPSVYPHHYQTPPPVEVPYPSVGIPAQNIYHSPEHAPQMDGLGFYQNSHPQWQHPMALSSNPSTPPQVTLEPLQQVRLTGSPIPQKEDGNVASYSAQVPPQLQTRTEVSRSKSSSDASPSPPASPKNTVSVKYLTLFQKHTD